MCATSEGLLKGERWCKKCIWGNLLPRWKQDFGSVDNISSGDFVSLWTARINLLADRYTAASEGTFTDPPPAGRASLIAVTARTNSQLHRMSELHLHGVLAIANAEPTHSSAARSRRVRQARTRLSHATPVQLRRRSGSVRTRQASAVPE